MKSGKRLCINWLARPGACWENEMDVMRPSPAVCRIRLLLISRRGHLLLHPISLSACHFAPALTCRVARTIYRPFPTWPDQARPFFSHFLLSLPSTPDHMEIFSCLFHHPFYFLPLSRPYSCVRLMNDITSSRLHGKDRVFWILEHVVSREILIPNRLFFPLFPFWPSNFRDSHVSAGSWAGVKD